MVHWGQKIGKFCEAPRLADPEVSLRDLHSFADKRCKNILQSKYENAWEKKRIDLSKNSKLDLYITLKRNFGAESYLDSTDWKLRKAITKMRVSAHGLPVETGRYLGIPRIEHICPACNNGVGNEAHYLVQCQNVKIKAIRDPILDQISNSDPSFLSLGVEEKCDYLLACRNPLQFENIGYLCLKIQSTFKEVCPRET